jgi:dihydrofolate reductase
MSNPITISLIVAMDNNQGIGKDGKLPWNLPYELRHFRKVTMGKAVLMGRKTYESIGKPLNGRLNLVMTKDVKYNPPELIIDNEVGSTVIIHPQAAVNMASILGYNEIFVIGGSEIYELFLPFADNIYVSNIDASLDCDTFFPIVDWTQWDEEKLCMYSAGRDNDYDIRCRVYHRKIES